MLVKLIIVKEQNKIQQNMYVNIKYDTVMRWYSTHKFMIFFYLLFMYKHKPIMLCGVQKQIIILLIPALIPFAKEILWTYKRGTLCADH